MVVWDAEASGPPFRQWVDGPLGFSLEVCGKGAAITGVRWRREACSRLPSPGPAADPFRFYFTCPRHVFQCRLALRGTPFCRRVWRALLEIPPGRVSTYGELAFLLGTSPRAVAAACRANPYPVVVPCHRVVAKTGPGGYCGQVVGKWLDLKRWLLKHEGWHG